MLARGYFAGFSPTGEMAALWVAFTLGSLAIIGHSVAVWRRHRREPGGGTTFNPRRVPYCLAIGALVGGLALGWLVSVDRELRADLFRNYCSDSSRSSYRIGGTPDGCRARLGACLSHARRHPAPPTASSYLPSRGFERAMVLCLQSKQAGAGR